MNAKWRGGVEEKRLSSWTGFQHVGTETYFEHSAAPLGEGREFSVALAENCLEKRNVT